MPLVERFWAAAVSFISIFSFSPIPDGYDSQVSLQAPLIVSPIHQVSDFPIFRPPGGSDESKFKCEYPDMPDWVDCSHELDRKCWLRRKSDGKQFDINTDYEHLWPIGVDRHYTLDLADSWWAADGLNFTEAKLFNNRYPGPWIQACWGDRLIVNVTNSMKHNGTSVHWHGIRMWNTTHMDGVNGVTQCPIAPGDYFVYNFTLQQYGSSWYHSHYSVQYADGALGPMTIHGPSSGDWDEAISPPLIMTDWYHNSAFKVVSGGDNGGKDILLNGRGNITKFNNSITNTTTIKAALNITFESPRPGEGCKKYLIRVINTSFDSTFVFSIDNHLLSIVSADFVPIQPYRNTSVLVGIGQRYNIVVEANPLNKSSPLDPEGNYWIRTQIADCFHGSLEGDTGYDEVGILRYNESSTSDPTTKRWPKISLKCSDETYSSLNPILPWTVKAPINGAQNKASPRFGEAFNVYYEEQPKKYPLAQFVMDKPNASAPMRVNYSDPIFLHLNPKDKKPWPDLWRVESEEYTNSDWAENKEWDPTNMSLKLNNPPRRDVVLLPTNGYVVMAFKADNPGPWIVHCHIAFHISWGLGMQIMEDQAGAFALWPDDDDAILETERVCGNWDSWYSKKSNWANKPVSAGGNCTEHDEDFCFQDDSGV